MSDDRSMELFFELFSGLPRQGPGSAECTQRALSMVPALGSEGRILDIGSGSGAQTMMLAQLTQATILAVDLHPPFVAELNATAQWLGHGDRVRGEVGDMQRLDLPAEAFDLIWSEGAIYFVGFEAGLKAWRRLLKPGGHAAVSELCWFEAEPPAECARYFAAEYPPMCDIAANRAAIARAGYDLIGDFRLPSRAWWQDYYEPLQSNLAAFEERHGDDPVAAEIAGQTEREIDLFRRFSDCYGYAFFVMRKRGA